MKGSKGGELSIFYFYPNLMHFFAKCSSL